MSENQGIPRTRVSLAQGKLGLLVNRALVIAAVVNVFISNNIVNVEE